LSERKDSLLDMSLVLSVLVHSVAAAAFGLLQLQPPSPLLQWHIPPMDRVGWIGGEGWIGGVDVGWEEGWEMG
jgi:hypothetical protein